MRPFAAMMAPRDQQRVLDELTEEQIDAISGGHDTTCGPGLTATYCFTGDGTALFQGCDLG